MQGQAANKCQRGMQGLCHTRSRSLQGNRCMHGATLEDGQPIMCNLRNSLHLLLATPCCAMAAAAAVAHHRILASAHRHHHAHNVDSADS